MGYQPYMGFCEEVVPKFHYILKAIFIDSNTFKGNFTGNTSSDASDCLTWRLLRIDWMRNEESKEF